MKAARDIIAGVLRYAAAKRGWNVYVHGGHPNDRDDARSFSPPDGIITGYTSDDVANPVPAGMRRNIPTVFTCIPPEHRMKAPFASIYADDRAIGEAADIFREAYGRYGAPAQGANSLEPLENLLPGLVRPCATLTWSPRCSPSTS